MSLLINATQTYRVIAYFDNSVTAAAVTGSIAKYNSIGATPAYGTATPFSPIGLTTGAVYYDWIPATDGVYKIEFNYNGIIDSNVYIVGPLSQATVSLGVAQNYYFLGELTPLFIDPNEVLKYFPDGDLVEITEYIHTFSKELSFILDQPMITEVTPLMENFILASVLCRLSRIYTFSGGMSGFASADSFTLGDLMVKKEQGGKFSSSGNGDMDANNWCDLAAALKIQLTTGKANLKAIVAGSNFANPIPERHLRRFERR